MSQTNADLVRIGDSLDHLGLEKEADLVDQYMQKVAAIPIAIDDLPILARVAKIVLAVKDLQLDDRATAIDIALPLVGKSIEGAPKRNIIHVLGMIISRHIQQKMYPKQQLLEDPREVVEYDRFIEAVEDLQELLADYSIFRAERDPSTQAFSEIKKEIRKLVTNLERLAVNLMLTTKDGGKKGKGRELHESFKQIISPLIYRVEANKRSELKPAIQQFERDIEYLLPKKPSKLLQRAIIESSGTLSSREKDKIQKQILEEQGIAEEMEQQQNAVNILNKQRTRIRNLLQRPMLQMRKYNEKIRGTFLDQAGDIETGIFVDELKGLEVAAALLAPSEESEPTSTEFPSYLEDPIPEQLSLSIQEEPEITSLELGRLLTAFNPKNWTMMQRPHKIEEAKQLREAIKENYNFYRSALTEVDKNLKNAEQILEEELGEHKEQIESTQWDIWRQQAIETPITAIKATMNVIGKEVAEDDRLQRKLFDKLEQLLQWERQYG